MRILHALTHYDLLTGSGLYVYELARVLAARGHTVAVVAEHVGGELTARTRSVGVAVHALADVAAGSELGPFDLLHVHQAGPGRACLSRWPAAAVVATVHSPWPADDPLVSDRVAAYICVRPEIRRKVVAADGVPSHRTLVLLNGVDRSRFHPRPPAPARNRPCVLFPATLSEARRPAVVDLLRRSVADGFDVLLLGLGDGGYLRDLPPNARWEATEVWDVEEHIAVCDQVAGTFVGRTAIEGWMCGKPVWVYDIFPFHRVRSVAVHPPPPAALLDLCDVEEVTTAVERVYADAVR